MNTHDTPLSALFKHPVMILFTQIFVPLVLLGLMGMLFWLDAGKMETAATLLLSATALFNIITLGFTTCALKSRNLRDYLPWVNAALQLLASVTFLILMFDNAEPTAELPVWLGVDIPIVGLLFVGHLLVLQCALISLLACYSPFAPSKTADVGYTLLSLFILIGLSLLLTFSFRWLSSGWIWLLLAFTFAIGILIVHLLGLLSAAHSLLCEKIPGYNLCLRILFVGLFPLLALAANAKIPLPFNMQTPWMYTLILLFSLSILLPSNRLTAFVRWAMLPASAYFFLLFVPFLPFIILLIIVCGVGFLLLIPLFVFWQHAQSLRDVRLPKCVIALALLILPIGFLLITERDRIVTRVLIEHFSTPDYTTGKDTLPMSEKQARAAAHTIYLYEQGDRMPFLSRWRDFRLFDSLHPRQEVMDALTARFGKPEIWGHAKRWRPQRSAQKASELSPTLTFTPGDAGKITAHLTIPADAGKEFRSPLTLADGVWVTGMRLQLPDGQWKTATLRDRRTATWMYKDIVEKRLDPALLTLDTPTSGNLRVFPLECDRHVELDLLMPRADWCAVPLALGKHIDLPVSVPGEDPREVVSVCFISEGKAPEGFGLYVVGSGEITVQTTPPDALPEQADADTKRAERFARGYAYAHNLRLGEATFCGDDWEELKQSYTPEKPRAALPKLAPDTPWQLGTQMWQLAEAMAHNQTLDYRKEIRTHAETCGVLTPTNAYIVVETEQQERQLALSDLAVKHADLAFDIEQTETATSQSAPGALLLAALFLLLLPLLRKLKARKHLL